MMNFYGLNNGGMMAPYLPFLGGLVLLELVLKGFALWKAARSNQMYWFIALLVINTAGILPAVYLLIYNSKKK